MMSLDLQGVPIPLLHNTGCLQIVIRNEEHTNSYTIQFRGTDHSSFFKLNDPGKSLMMYLDLRGVPTEPLHNTACL